MQNITLGGSRRKNKTLKNKIITGILLALVVFLSIYNPQLKQSTVSVKIEVPKAKEIQ